MKISSQPSWSDVRIKKTYPKLNQDLVCDVLIIGGGITGITTAYLLSKTNKKVVLIERDEIASGSTYLTTAFITQAIDTKLSTLVRRFGYHEAKLVWQAGADAISLIEKIAKKEKINCQFQRCSAFDYANSSDDLKILKKDEKYAKRMGFSAKFSEQDDLNFINAGYLEIKNQAKFHPVKFVTQLAKRASQKGARIFEDTEAINISEDMVETKDSFFIRADWIITATHLPFNEPKKLFMRKGKYITYIMECKIPPKVLKEGIYMDQEIPYHYFRIDSDLIGVDRMGKFDKMIIGGEDHRAELDYSETESFANLEKYLKEAFPTLKYKIVRQWTGPIIESSDGLALLGQIDDYNLVATGHSGNGITYGAIAGMIFRDIIEGNKSPYIELFSPNRVPHTGLLIRKGVDYTKEFINIAVAHTIFKPRKHK